jgi:hypothetical protein
MRALLHSAKKRMLIVFASSALITSLLDQGRCASRHLQYV